jgi:hypothetical protein
MAERFANKQAHDKVLALKDLTYHSSLINKQISHNLQDSFTLISHLKQSLITTQILLRI